MSAPIIWIAIPIFISLLLFIIREYRFLTLIFGGITCLLLALMAFTFKIEVVFPIGPLSLEIPSTFSILGRNFVITENELFIVGLIFTMGAFWIFGSRIAGTNMFFVPIILAMSALFIAALSVQPFLYAALIIEIVVLISIPIFFQKTQPVKQGVIRFLVFQTIAVPFILFSGWALNVAPTSVDSQLVYIQAGILLFIGIGLWLAIFPFYTWVPLLSKDGHPYAAGFIFSMYTSTIFIFLMDFFNNYNWLREETLLLSISQILGIIMVVLGGLFAAFQKELTRLLGYAVMVEIGFSLLALSLSQEIGWRSYILLLIPRIFGIAICSLTISLWRNQGLDMKLETFKGQIFKTPYTLIGFLLGWFTLAGLPLLGGFPTKLPVLIGLSQTSINPIFFVSLGLFGLFVSGFRFLSFVFSRPEGENEQISEPLIQKLFIIIGVLFLGVMGILPNLVLNPFLEIISAFSNLR